MAKGYILATVRVTDAEAYRASGYMAMAEESVAAFGGRFMVRGGEPLALEGDAPAERIVILEFPSRDQAAAFHASATYAPAITLRQSLAESRLLLLSEYVP
jgi:uncharacterized protein (DUF1330 family)